MHRSATWRAWRHWPWLPPTKPRAGASHVATPSGKRQDPRRSSCPPRAWLRHLGCSPADSPRPATRRLCQLGLQGCALRSGWGHGTGHAPRGPLLGALRVPAWRPGSRVPCVALGGLSSVSRERAAIVTMAAPEQTLHRRLHDGLPAPRGPVASGRSHRVRLVAACNGEAAFARPVCGRRLLASTAGASLLAPRCGAWPPSRHSVMKPRTGALVCVWCDADVLVADRAALLGTSWRCACRCRERMASLLLRSRPCQRGAPRASRRVLRVRPSCWVERGGLVAATAAGPDLRCSGLPPHSG